MDDKAALIGHLQTGATTTCRAWRVTRKDGQVFGFTDHDQDLAFEGTIFTANSGLTPGMLQQSSGLAVDNTEVAGALSDVSITETDLRAGRFDGAEVTAWLVNWQNLDERAIRFRGHFGEIQIAGGSFRVELRGLSDVLNQVRAKVYQPSCAAVLGDNECRVDLSQPQFNVETTIKALGNSGEYFVPSQPSFSPGWFMWGKAQILSGRAMGLVASIRFDEEKDGQRRIELMSAFDLSPQVGDDIRLVVGCDREGATCRAKFNNFLNFRGFPHIPGTDWLASYPTPTQRNDGGSRLK